MLKELFASDSGDSKAKQGQGWPGFSWELRGEEAKEEEDNEQQQYNAEEEDNKEDNEEEEEEKHGTGFVSKNGSVTWSPHPRLQHERTSDRTLGSGPRGEAKTIGSPGGKAFPRSDRAATAAAAERGIESVFLLFVTDGMVHAIVNATNREGSASGATWASTTVILGAPETSWRPSENSGKSGGPVCLSYTIWGPR